MNCNRCQFAADSLTDHATDTGHPLCVVDQRRSLTEHEPQTCARCVADVRVALADLAYGLSILEVAGYPATSGPTDAARSDEEPLPGGDALILAGPGGNVWRTNPRRTSGRPTPRGDVEYPELGRGVTTTGDPVEHPAWTREDEANYGAEHKADNWPTDTPSVLAELAAWEDDWRQTYGDPAGGLATVTETVAYLNGNLDSGHKAAQTHPAFDEFAVKVRALSAAVNRVTRHRPEVSVERRSCIDCGGDLERVIFDLDRPVLDRLRSAQVRIAADDEVLVRKPDARVPERREVVRRELTGDVRDGRLQAWECRRCRKPYNREEFWNAVRQRMQNDRDAKEAG